MQAGMATSSPDFAGSCGRQVIRQRILVLDPHVQAFFFVVMLFVDAPEGW